MIILAYIGFVVVVLLCGAAIGWAVVGVMWAAGMIDLYYSGSDEDEHEPI